MKQHAWRPIPLRGDAPRGRGSLQGEAGPLSEYRALQHLREKAGGAPVALVGAGAHGWTDACCRIECGSILCRYPRDGETVEISRLYLYPATTRDCYRSTVLQAIFSYVMPHVMPRYAAAQGLQHCVRGPYLNLFDIACAVLDFHNFISYLLCAQMILNAHEYVVPRNR